MRESDEKGSVVLSYQVNEKFMTETICTYCGQSVGPNHYRNTDKGVCEKLNSVKIRAELLLQDLLHYAAQIQTKLEADVSEEELKSTAECLSNSLKELDVLSYL